MGTQTPEQVVARIRELRDILDVPVEAAAAKLGVSPDVYLEYESGARPIPINSLYGLAELFKTDVTVLLTGALLPDRYSHLFVKQRFSE